MDNEKKIEAVKATKDITGAMKDIQKIDEILQDANKFYQKSNQVYYEIVSKMEYAPYFMLTRTTNNLKPGNVLFENIPDYLTKRKIIMALREAVIAYELGTAKKATEDKK